MSDSPRKTFLILLALVSAVGIAVAVFALRCEMTWYESAGMFYGLLAAAELAFLAILLLDDVILRRSDSDEVARESTNP